MCVLLAFRLRSKLSRRRDLPLCGPKKGLFYSDAMFRPCALQQQFIGITEKKASNRYQVVNEVCYEKVLDRAGKNQSLLFVHSQKETAKMAKFLRDMAVEKETIVQFVRPEGTTREILTEESSNVKDSNLRDLPFGFAIHHASMSREDRTLVKDLFSEGHVQVLVCTTTFAWGVNLPAQCHHHKSSTTRPAICAHQWFHRPMSQCDFCAEFRKSWKFGSVHVKTFLHQIPYSPPPSQASLHAHHSCETGSFNSRRQFHCPAQSL